MTRNCVPALFALGACLTASPAPVCAQSADDVPAFEIAVGPSWFVANAASWGAHASLRWQLPGEFRQLSLGAVAFHGPARADSTSPAVSSLGVEAALATRDPRGAPAFILLLTFGVAGTRFDARLQREALADCVPALGCMAEGVVTYHTGDYLAWVPGAAVEIRLSSTLAVRPHVRVLFTRDHPVFGTQSVSRLDVGFAWRP